MAALADNIEDIEDNKEKVAREHFGWKDSYGWFVSKKEGDIRREKAENFAGKKIQADLNQGIIDLAEKGDAAAVGRLLSKGANPSAGLDPGRYSPALDEYAPKGCTPLHFAAAAGHSDVAELLIAKNAEIDAKLTAIGAERFNFTPLHFASIMGQSRVAEVLVAGGAKVDARAMQGEQQTNKRGFMPAQLALYCEYPDNKPAEVLDVLLAAGADKTCTYGYTNDTLLHRAVGNTHHWEAIMTVLFKHGIDVDAEATNADDCMVPTTALMDACNKEDCPPEMVELLVANGADVKKRCSHVMYESMPEMNNVAALNLAAQRASVKIVEILLDHGAEGATFLAEYDKYKSKLPKDYYNEEVMAFIRSWNLNTAE